MVLTPWNGRCEVQNKTIAIARKTIVAVSIRKAQLEPTYAQGIHMVAFSNNQISVNAPWKRHVSDYTYCNMQLMQKYTWHSSGQIEDPCWGHHQKNATAKPPVPGSSMPCGAWRVRTMPFRRPRAACVRQPGSSSIGEILDHKVLRDTQVGAWKKCRSYSD